MSDAFDVLELPVNATVVEVKGRWRELAARHHPDKGGDAEQFDTYRKAYESALREAQAPKPCPSCNGTGQHIVRRGFAQAKLPCGLCGGTGHVSPAEL